MKANEKTYDNVFRTLVNDYPVLVLPLINELFGENYRGDEEVILLSESLPQITEEGVDMKISDSNIAVIGKEKKKYHLECQSSEDNDMVIRMFEYDVREAIRSAVVKGHDMELTLAKSAVIYLRYKQDTPDVMKMKITAGDNSLSYEMPIMKIGNYTDNDIFERDLLFLLPFHFFVYENDLQEYNEDEEKLRTLKESYESILTRLDTACKRLGYAGDTGRSIVEMMIIVAERLARKYENVRKGATDSMYGKVLDYSTKDILNQGRAEGRLEGKLEGKLEARVGDIKGIMESFGVDAQRACSVCGLSDEEAAEVLKLLERE